MIPFSDRPRTTVIIPAKRLDAAKSRLQLPDATRRHVAFTLLKRTLRAVTHARGVGHVVVVTTDPVLAQEAVHQGALVVPEPESSGLNASLAMGRGRALEISPESPVAFLVADVPMLDPEDLSAVIDEYWLDGDPLFVTDHGGLGTTMLIHGPNVRMPIHFGPRSAKLHSRHGYQHARGSLRSLRRDLDTNADLEFILSEMLVRKNGNDGLIRELGLLQRQ